MFMRTNRTCFEFVLDKLAPEIAHRWNKNCFYGSILRRDNLFSRCWKKIR